MSQALGSKLTADFILAAHCKFGPMSFPAFTRNLSSINGWIEVVFRFSGWWAFN